MKNYAMFKYEFLFGDYFAKASPKAKLLYVNLSFYADCGFVANPVQICKAMGYDESVLQELVSIGELLTLPGRSEMFIASYFVHNVNFKPLSWIKTPFGEYWKGKLFVKDNRIATLNTKYARTPAQKLKPEEKQEEQIDNHEITQEELEREKQEMLRQLRN